MQLDDARQRQVLRMWLMQLNFPLPSAIKLRQIQRDFLQARIDKLPSIRWKNVELRRYRDTLYAFPLLKKHDPTQIFQWNFTQPLMIPNIGLLEAAFEKTKGLSPDLKNITVRFRQGGERCRLAGRKCHHDLKKLFQEWNVPPWERDRIPLIYTDNQLIAAVGFFIDDNFVAKEGYFLKLS